MIFNVLLYYGVQNMVGLATVWRSFTHSIWVSFVFVEFLHSILIHLEKKFAYRLDFLILVFTLLRIRVSSVGRFRRTVFCSIGILTVLSSSRKFRHLSFLCNWRSCTHFLEIFANLKSSESFDNIIFREAFARATNQVKKWFSRSAYIGRWNPEYWKISEEGNA